MGVRPDDGTLRTELEALYEAFADVRKPVLRPTDPQAYDADWIGQQQLRELPAKLINDLAFELGATLGDSDDVRYFLPRLCELLVRGELHAVLDGPILLADKLIRAHWRQWSAPEQEAVDAFLVAFFDATLSIRTVVFLELMIAVAILFDDLSPWLARVRSRVDVAAVWALRELAKGRAARLLRKKDRPRPFLEGRMEQEDQLLAWLREPASLAQLESLRHSIRKTSADGEDLTLLYEEAKYWLQLCGASGPAARQGQSPYTR